MSDAGQTTKNKPEAIAMDPMFNSKEPCRKFLAGLCPHEEKDCKFKHIKWPPGKTTICTWFNSKGKGCKKGDDCPQHHLAVGQPALDFLLAHRAKSQSPGPGKGKGKDKGKRAKTRYPSRGRKGGGRGK